MEAIIPEPTLSGREPGARVTNSALEVCKSDPNPIGFRNKNIDFGSDRISCFVVGSDQISSLDVDHFFSLSFVYVFLVFYLI